MSFFIKFDPKIETMANQNGFSGPNWKQAILTDVYYDDRLHVEKGHDPRDPAKRVWYCIGRRISLACVPDRQVLDALFCIGLVRRPLAGGTRLRGSVFEVPGPFAVHTFMRRPPPPITVEQQILSYVVDFARELPVPMGPLKHAAFANLKSSIVLSNLPLKEAPVAPDPPQIPDITPALTPGVTDVNEITPETLRPAANATVEAPGEPSTREAITQRAPAEAIASMAEQADSKRLPESKRREDAQRNGEALHSTESWGALALAVVVQSSPALDGLIGTHDPVDARRHRIARLEAEIDRLREELARVPDEAMIIEGDELRRRISDLGARVGAKPPSCVRVSGPELLERVLAALANEAAKSIPTWAVEFDIDEERARLHVLTEPGQQRRLLGSLVWVQRRFAGAPPERLRILPKPDEPGDVEAMLDSAWMLEEALTKAAGALPASCIPLLRALPPARVPHSVETLSGWHVALSSRAFDELSKTIGGDPNVFLQRRQDLPINGLSPEDREILKDIGTFDSALKFVMRCAQRSQPPSPQSSRTREAARITGFDHVVTDDRGSIIAPPIVVPTADQGATTVLLEFPVRIMADGPLTAETQVTVTSSALTAVSRDVVLPKSVQIRATAKGHELLWQVPAEKHRWQPIESGKYCYEDVLPLPITLGEAERLRSRKTTRVSLTLAAGDASAVLSFEKILNQMPELATGTGVGSASATELVRNRPLGVQIHYKKLESVVAEGRLSLMVVAPRRFGKTTLFLHLAEHGSTGGHEVVKISLDRDLGPDEAVKNFWEGLRRHIQDRYGASPAYLDPTPRTLTDEAAWTSVRRFLRNEGRGSLIVLIDEAQALVPRSGGQRWGNQFKNFVERFLMEPRENLASVQIGFFGTVDFSVRIGQNCRDFLLMHGTEQYTFDEASLARFIRTVGQGAILSSKAGRVQLASWTSNLRTLGSVFEQVQTLLAQRRRIFMLDLDVRRCIDNILAADSPLADQIWKYARSELSHRDDWEPIDSFPLAVAWSRAELAGMTQPDRLQECVRWLNQELIHAKTTGSVPPERAEAGLRDLKTRGVLRDDGEFYRPLLRELMRRRLNVLREDRDSQLVLLRLAVDDVEWPEHVEKRDEGGQARIFVHARGEQTLAYRACALDSDESRRRFAKTCAAIRTLRDRRTKMPGDDHLPRVLQAGFRSDSTSEGVIVYEWVEGDIFDSLWLALPPSGRAHIVRQIAKAVSALHARDVIHCDIVPRNIIVNSRLLATLIDFGLARRTDHSTQTRLVPDSFKAPEQCGAQPFADKPSDIYALGILLRGPDKHSVPLSPDLQRLVEQMTQERPEDRLTIKEVLIQLDELVDFEPVLHQLQTSVEDAIQDAPECLWEELLSFAGSASLSHGKYLLWDKRRAMEVSFLLNNLFVRIVAEQRGSDASELASCSRGDELSLALVRARLADDRSGLLRVWGCKEVKAVGLLRIAWAHPMDRDARVSDAMRELNSSESNFLDKIRRAVMKVAEMLDRLAVSGNAIRRFVEFYTGSD